MIISGLQINAFKANSNYAGREKTPQISKANFEVASVCKDKMSALNAPFDIFLKECVKSDLAQKGGEKC